MQFINNKVTNKNLDKLLERVKDIPRFPYFANLQVTRKCNFNCMHCGFDAGKQRKKEFSTSEVIGLVNQLYELNCEKIQITGGEPLLREDIFTLASYGTSLGIEMHLLSNGYLIDKGIVKKIKESRIGGAGVSIDGLKKSHNTFRRKKDSFQKAINALRLLKKQDIYTCVLTTVNKLSINELNQLYDFLSDTKVDSWVIQTTARVGRMKKFQDYALEPKDMEEVANFIVRAKQKKNLNVVAGDSVGYFTALEDKLRDGNCFTGCYAGILQVGILSDGGVIGCLALPHIDKFIEGNIREKSLAEIWFDSNTFAYNRKFSKDLLEGDCKKCDYGEICRAGCKSNAYGATGSEHNNPYCLYRLEKNK